MGLSASQIRYLSLTARQSDLEYQAQVINNVRLDLTNKSSDATRAYTEGMNNTVIRIATNETTTSGTTKQVWNTLNYSNLLEQGYQIIGTGGAAIVPSPYNQYKKGEQFSYEEYMNLPASARSKCTSNGDETYTANSAATVCASGSTLTEAEYSALEPSLKAGEGTVWNETTNPDGSKTYTSEGAKWSYTVSADEKTKTYTATEDINIERGATIGYSTYMLMNSDNQAKCENNNNGTYTAGSYLNVIKSDYKGADIQTLLVSGQAQLCTNTFYQYLCEHGYGTGVFWDDEGNETTYEKLLDKFQGNAATSNVETIVDWQADAKSRFKEELYTEDDARVLADYEAATAEIQSQDKKLEMQLKQIETEHKAIESEMEAIKKVIEKNIENSYKTFG